MIRARVVLLSMAASVLALSCRQIADIERRPACEEPAASDPACAACNRAECCDQAAACLADAPCAAANACLDACESEDCRASCSRKHAAGFGAGLANLLSCRSRSCRGACGVSCGGYVFGSEACADCSGDHCCEEAKACGEDAACLALAYCEKACRRNDTVCRTECEYRHRSGIEVARALSSCAEQSCRAECSYQVTEPDWGCGTGLKPYVPGELPFTHQFVLGVMANASYFDDRDDPCVGTLRVCPREVAGKPSSSCDQQLQSVTGDWNKGVDVNIQPGSQYYFWVEDQEGCHVQSLLYYPDPPPTEDTGDRIDHLSPAAFAEVYGKIAVIDPERGHLLVRAVDCDGIDAPAVSYSIDPADTQAVPFYGRFADVPGAETVASDSHGGFLNLLPDSYKVIARRRDTGTCVAVREVVVRKGFSTIVSPMNPGGCPP